MTSDKSETSSVFTPSESAARSNVGEGKSSRFLGFVLSLAVLVVLFCRPLYQLALYAAHSNLHSHIFLIPLVSAYLIQLEWKKLPKSYESAPVWTGLLGAAGAAFAFLGWRFSPSTSAISLNDHLALFALAVVCFIGAAGFFWLGAKWMRAAAFPFLFLIFFVPMPDAMADALEEASKLASAEVANALFGLTGTPVLRNGTVFGLPGITLEVAKECSGIRSSYVLVITSLLASYLFLKSPWRRAGLVAAVIPLGLLRNGVRILVIALLCIHIGPEMIHSVIHRRGGPLFFAASLVPLFGLLWWLRRGDKPGRPMQ